jgi:hypothetical protein
MDDANLEVLDCQAELTMIQFEPSSGGVESQWSGHVSKLGLEIHHLSILMSRISVRLDADS